MSFSPSTHNTGPGEYECGNALGRGKLGLLCQRDDRFKPVDNRVPGPGAYTVRKLLSVTSFVYEMNFHLPSMVDMYSGSPLIRTP